MQQSAMLSALIKNRRRNFTVGLFLIVEALLIFLLLGDTSGKVSTFVLAITRAGTNIGAPDLVVPTWSSILALGTLVGVTALWQLIRGFQRTNAVVISMVAVGIAAFLIWATRDKSLNLTGMLVSSVIRATPIALAALSGLYSERSGVVNIGIEGMMLMGAFVSVVAASVAGNLYVGFAAGILAGVVLALLHAVLSIRYSVNQIVSGTSIIILSLGLTSYIFRAFIDPPHPELNSPGSPLAAVAIPFLWRIPVVGPILFNQSPIIYILFMLLIATQIFFYSTKWGLRIRSVGENPKAADTLGINVSRLRYISVLISGGIAGLGGAYMSIGSVGFFNEGMSAGKGFLGLAAMIFGNWNPGGAFLGSLVFGFFDSWQEKLSILQVGVPTELLGMAPYIATMIVLAGFIGRSRMPAADGTPYEKQ